MNFVDLAGHSAPWTPRHSPKAARYRRSHQTLTGHFVAGNRILAGLRCHTARLIAWGIVKPLPTTWTSLCVRLVDPKAAGRAPHLHYSIEIRIPSGHSPATVYRKLRTVAINQRNASCKCP